MNGALRRSSSAQKAARLSLISVNASRSFLPETSRMVLLKLLIATPPCSLMRLKYLAVKSGVS